MSVLGDLSVEVFLKEYWHKKPVLIRNAYPNFQNPVDKEELAGLSVEPDVESRIVIERGSEQWELKHGPFGDNDFAELPKNKWTLLVQAVDHWVPEVKELLKDFDFIPRWRLDDIMISYATTGGSVGPHSDYYDVFLIQGAGQRRWQIDRVCDETDEILPNTPVKILKEFTAQEEWVLNPGDMLYLPPGVAHNGVALDDECMTLSVGFRAPSDADIACEFGAMLTELLPDHHRYGDPEREVPEHAGMIDEKSVQIVKGIMQRHIDDPTLMARWLGRYMTEPKYADHGELGAEIAWSEIAEMLQDSHPERHPASRFATYQSYLFVDSKEYLLDTDTKTLANYIADSHQDLQSEQLLTLAQTPKAQQLLADMFSTGALVFVDDDWQDGDYD
ncbi:cupin domain-containing protein [Salinibius halmophilus]|uniref:cupin domain-containing protein n=1 Tax=Salinibius halmophilus TaxID=1853216 RepID=UPI000E66A8AF|nr:cupin domain-containing protein [Salinibius halmophilus]